MALFASTFTFCKFKQTTKTALMLEPINNESPEPMLTLVKPEQLRNAPLSIFVTEFGIVMLVKPIQL